MKDKVIKSMKNILFFDRCELTDLYISIGCHLNKVMNVIHVAFSNEEIQKLISAGITNYIDYQKILNYHIDNSPVCLLTIQEIDDLIIKTTEGRFNLNSSMQGDRGFSILTYDEALLLVQSHYLAWSEIFSQYKVDIMYHEICSQFMVHIAAILCKNQGGKYRDTIQCNSDKGGYWYINVDGENYTCTELQNKYDYYKRNPNCIDKERCVQFLNEYRKNYTVFFGSEIKSHMPYFKIAYFAIKSVVAKWLRLRNFDRIKNNITYWLISSNLYAKKLKNLQEYRKAKITFITDIPVDETYYYYSFHLEPEATVLYMGDGIYENQVKLIQNIASSLPAGSYLYVKDHPHEYAYRDACDYERLLKVPNIRLIHQSIPGKQLIAKAKGVFSINGTACFEALLLGKQVFCMGNSYYSYQERVNVMRNVRDIRDIVYSLKDVEYNDDDNLLAFVNAYLESVHPGYVDFFCSRHITLGIDLAKNGEMIAKTILQEIDCVN